MTHTTTNPNVFVVDTPHQLLNAIEAVHSLQLTNNHLVVITTPNADQSRFIFLINASDWATVSFPSPYINGKRWVEKLLGPMVDRWYCRYLHFRRLRLMAQLTSRFRHVDNLFLGHYFADEKPFMRHIANTITYNALYLLDDGTDTIEINKRRHTSDHGVGKDTVGTSVVRSPWFKTIEARFRAKYWEWSLAEPPSVTFFTVFDIEVRQGDRLIKNNYSYLRQRAPREQSDMRDTVLFLGQCIADGYIELEAHCEFLSTVREYFAKENFIYVAHPRESVSCLARVKESLQCEIWPSSSVIEYDLLSRGIKPKAIAGFVSSALVTLACLMDSNVEIVCFEIAPGHWIRWREDAIGVYDYFKTKAKQRVTIVPLSRRGHECGSPYEGSV